MVDHRDTWVAEDTLDTRLTLVTCYPFDAIRPGGPLRYVVSAVLDSPATVAPQGPGVLPPTRARSSSPVVAAS